MIKTAARFEAYSDYDKKNSSVLSAARNLEVNEVELGNDNSEAAKLKYSLDAQKEA